jgi:hypothetical protein
MERKPFQTLARVIQTLAVGRAFTLPFAMGARDTEWSETFEVAVDRIDGELSVMHRMTTRKGGMVREQMATATDWSLDDMLKLIVELDDETLAFVERGLMPLDDAGPTVEGIADLSDGPGVAMVAGRAWRREGDTISLTVDGDPKWSFDAAVMAVKQGR